jgi:cell division protein FtsW (lipid II flippase)
MALYAGVIARGIWIARHARDRFGQLLAVGLTAIVFWQVAINVGMASGVLPVVGIPLPLVSYGGSSLIAMMAAMGVMSASIPAATFSSECGGHLSDAHGPASAMAGAPAAGRKR